MTDRERRSRLQALIWGARFAPERNGCAKTSGSAAAPTSSRRLRNRLQSTIALKTPTSGARAAHAANTHRHRLDRIPKNEPMSQTA